MTIIIIAIIITFAILSIMIIMIFLIIMTVPTWLAAQTFGPPPRTRRSVIGASVGHKNFCKMVGLVSVSSGARNYENSTNTGRPEVCTL